MRRVIAFTGPAGCGKTTAAECLPGVKLSFATPMKKCLKDLFKFTHEQLYTLEGKTAVDPRYGVSPRVIMQKFGTEFVRQTVPDLWLILMKANIEAVDSWHTILIDDVRFEDEAQLIRGMGGTVWHIIGRKAFKEDAHKSESGVLLDPMDEVIYNEGSLELFREDVARVVG